MEPTASTYLDLIHAVNLVALILFTIGASVGATLTAVRYFRYRIDGDEPPELLTRDLWARGGLAAPFAGVLVIRALGLDPFTEWWGGPWFILSSAAAVAGVWIYVWYEAFIIER